MRNTPENTQPTAGKKTAWDRLTDDEKAELILINEAAKRNNERNTAGASRN